MRSRNSVYVVDFAATPLPPVPCANGGKVTICHNPPGNPGNRKSKSVHCDSLPAHLAHGDTVGECEEGGTACEVCNLTHGCDGTVNVAGVDMSCPAACPLECTRFAPMAAREHGSRAGCVRVESSSAPEPAEDRRPGSFAADPHPADPRCPCADRANAPLSAREAYRLAGLNQLRKSFANQSTVLHGQPHSWQRPVAAHEVE